MAATSLADIIEPETFNKYTVQRTLEKSALIASGIMADLTGQVGSLIPIEGGRDVNMPFFNDLSGEDEILDDTTDLSIANVTTGQDKAAILSRAKVYGSNDLAADYAGEDPMALIADRFADFWQRRIQAITLSVMAGATSTTVVGGSMAANVLDISGLTSGAEFFDAESFIDAKGRLGDNDEALSGVMVHSDTKRAMEKMNLIDFIEPSEGGDPIPVYGGRRVIVDDAMPKSNGVYTTYLFGPGALGYATKAPKVPTEVGRDSLKGGGKEWLVNRKHLVVHPRGIAWTPGAGVPAKVTPSNAELATGANWKRVYEAKAIRIVKFVHKLAA